LFEVKYTIKNSSLTFNKLLENTKKNIGDDNFSNYDPDTNKCRVFLLGVLNGNNIGNALCIKKENFDQLPSLSKKIGRWEKNLGAIGIRL